MRPRRRRCRTEVSVIVDVAGIGVGVDIAWIRQRRFRRRLGCPSCRRAQPVPDWCDVRGGIVADLSGRRLGDCRARRSSAALKFPRSSRRTRGVRSTVDLSTRLGGLGFPGLRRCRGRRQRFLNGAGNLRHRRQQVRGRREESRGAVGTRISRNRVAAVVGGVDRQLQQRVADICDAVAEDGANQRGQRQFSVV